MKIIQPSEKLRSFVRYYWVLESNEPFSVLTFPIGCPQIIFHRKTPLYIPELDKSQSNFTIRGEFSGSHPIRRPIGYDCGSVLSSHYRYVYRYTAIFILQYGNIRI